MVRRVIWEPPVRRLVRDGLVPLFFRARSVHALTELLNDARLEGTPKIHPNRVHALLSEDARRALNDRTFVAIESAAAAVGDDPDPTTTAQFVDDVRGRVLARTGDVVGPDGAAELASNLGLPAAVVRHILVEAGRVDGMASPTTAPAHGAAAAPVHDAKSVDDVRRPDWSFQDDAIRACRRCLARAPGRKIGLIIPTGGGKTRTALRLVLEELAAAPVDARVLWVAHRIELLNQAKEELDELRRAGDSPPLLFDRVDFRMISQLDEYLRAIAPVLVVVDEAHHAAAASYAPVFDTPRPLRGLFLTATPNRTDGLPIKIDEIGYAITYRELADRGVILMPRFEPFPVADFAWEPDAVRELAEEVITRADGPYVKTLVVASTIAKVKEFYAALLDALAQYDNHRLDHDDVGFVVSDENSLRVPTNTFLKEFRLKPQAILVCADMLLEGFNDPTINAVVVTYPSDSLIRLMQAAGRSVRYAPAKRAAYVLQVRNEALAYYYDEGWLYQDISDLLRPRLDERLYADLLDLRQQVEAELNRHNVADAARETVLDRLDALHPDEPFRLLFTGLPYVGPRDDFAAAARWSVVPFAGADGDVFRRVFNDFCALGVPTDEPKAFLVKYFAPSEEPGSYWRLLYNMLLALFQAKAEINGGSDNGRPFVRNGSTTWLTYVTFRHRPVIPAPLEAFLTTCVNRSAVLADYLADKARWSAVARIELPLGGHLAWLLTPAQAAWALDARANALAVLRTADPVDVFAALDGWRGRLPSSPVPLLLLRRFDELLSEENFGRNWLTLAAS
ncbi:DEAD/DEAH box helicase family protein [Polyangium sp. 6x1]|uniref:DEAD/DEAH box helicase n=1 Tax=Polyangium sp. 6x1 TaxID=3042689 RepID=UPI002482D687|nr:DEAD/DEAH box helicase family protein [Polyangium sp. 6x1]MDI1450017.1 DEAD/DEAH box helicase family protein [Polyangium sp. 6x1]